MKKTMPIHPRIKRRQGVLYQRKLYSPRTALTFSDLQVISYLSFLVDCWLQSNGVKTGLHHSGIIFLRSANSSWRLQGRNILECLSRFCSKSIKKNFKINRLRKKKVRLNKICSGSEFRSILVEFRSKSLEEKNDPAKLIQFVSLRFGPSRKWSKNLRAQFALNSNNDAVAFPRLILGRNPSSSNRSCFNQSKYNCSESVSCRR